MRLPAVAAITIVALAMAAGPALGAIDGSVDPASARPGDWVELTTSSGTCCPTAYASIAAAGPTPLFVQRADPSSSGNACDTHVGDLTWTNGVGRARFQVPDVPPGSYWLLITVQGACWRFGDATGVLALTVLPAADRGPVPVLILLGIGAGLVAVVAGVIASRRRRPREIE
jgi:hypothetical protein